MNLFQLVSKQMRQRALSTWLTLLSIMLGVALAVAIMILRREGANLFGQTDFGYDILIGPAKGLAAPAHAQHRVSHGREPRRHPLPDLRGHGPQRPPRSLAIRTTAPT